MINIFIGFLSIFGIITILFTLYRINKNYWQEVLKGNIDHKLEIEN